MSTKTKKRIQKAASIATTGATILWLSGVSMLMPAVAATYVDGTLLKGSSSDIWVVNNNLKAPVRSAAVFNDSGYNWNNVKTVSDSALNSVPTADLIKTATSPDVFRLEKNFQRKLASIEIFNSYSLDWNKISTVSQPVMNSFSYAPIYQQSGMSGLYWRDANNVLHQFSSMDAFTGNGYQTRDLIVVNASEFGSFAIGEMITSAPSTPSTPTPTGGLTVSLASDTPVSGVAVESASRVQFTKVNFTASGGDVSITGLTIQRTGLADDSALSSVMLIDMADESQIGLNQTLNASHQVNFTDVISVPSGTTKTIMLAANMPASLDSYNGQMASLSLTAVTTISTVNATLPLTGNSMTINSTLTIGSMTVNRGSEDPGTDATKEVGTTNYKFTGLKFTAGSTEDMLVKSVKFNQSGSAATSDLSNLKVVFDGTEYSATTSSDGKYYTATFGSGVTIGKGLNKELYIKGDIANGSGRTISFDVYRDTDIVSKGVTYGYSVTAAGTSEQTTPTDGQFGSGTPFYNAYDVTVGTGSLRVDKNSTGAPSTNITEGATGVLLGAFDFVVQGESVNVSSIIVDFDHTGTGSTSDITNVTLYKDDGSVIAGPVNGTDETTSHPATLDGTRDGYATFSGTVTFPVGTTKVTVKGNLNTDFASDDTLRVGFNTPATKVTSATGVTTGNSITTTPASAIWGNAMTAKSGSLSVTVSGTPVLQTVVRGVTGYTFSNFVFDASASGEDVRVTYVEVEEVVSATGVGDEITSLQLWDGSTALNTGTNVVNPSEPTATTRTMTFTLDIPLLITKGTTKTIALKGNISGSATDASTHQMGLSGTAAEREMTVTGVSTGNSIDESITAAAGQVMTIVTGGQYSVTLDAGTPATRLMAANSTGNTMTTLRFKATAEQINVTKVRLTLLSPSSTGIDLASVSLYDGSTLLSTGAFGNYAGTLGGASTTFTLSPALQIPANEEKVLTIKADIAAISTSNTVATAGHAIRIDYYGSTDAAENVGTGMSSGASITGYSANSASNLAYIYRSVPTVAAVALPSTVMANGSMTLGKFKVTADAKGDVDLYKFTFKISTSTGSVTQLAIDNLTLVDVTDASEVTLYASTVGYYAAVSTGSIADFILLASPGTPGTSTVTPRTVAAGQSRTFELRGTLSGSWASGSISTQLEGDAVTTSRASGTYGLTAANVDINSGGNDFIWSDWSDADHSADQDGAAVTDWYNGYLVSGLPSSNLAAQIITK